MHTEHRSVNTIVKAPAKNTDEILHNRKADLEGDFSEPAKA